ncbi:T9SS C-terminal target domain-containing protein [Flavobacterium franklandianum]|uniref:T9SS C-terminal target domain-containing protein n=1 Tax=Flavobacterium franklandianum TaxID=2594430 RepID=A0A553C6E5_9FLAO|nr:T9SS C-terminal target domain-containing protein [Flavobacterium franklandianum]TRX15982.1 T9SS C-terminal target domain-containing protein [Flavobacterium franklandianum]TRX25058.1 T9SS C-terminal target domain-containing protein [Flavobacterium franklandianum]
MKKSLIFFFLILTSSYGQISGCTDAQAKNFNPNAINNDGSCVYASAKVKTKTSIKLKDSLRETSGLMVFEKLFWTHNDDHDTTIYGLDSNGIIQKKIKLEKVKNNDWEEISQDSSYIYIGDFGNNFKGNRKDLHLLRIEKKSFLTINPVIDTISFSYSNQTDFNEQKENHTDFDCEAFVVSRDSIYLFAKQWSQKKTTVYVLPKIPGKYTAKLKETLNVSGLITGATLLESGKGIVLCGYSEILQPFLYLLNDYKNNDFSTGNQRKIKLPLPFHQVEGIATEDGQLFYITNEVFSKKPFINVTQQIHTVDLSFFLRN